MTETTEITLPAPVDMHVHFRQDDLMKAVVGHHDRLFEYALAMPNTEPPIVSADDAKYYLMDLLALCGRMKPLVALMLTAETTTQTLTEAKKVGVKAVKLYPAGATHNSGGGVPMFQVRRHSSAFRDRLKCMADLGLILCVHGEDPDEPDLSKAEGKFLSVLTDLVAANPNLKFVLEHVSTKEGVRLVKRFKNTAGTITLHHLMLTKDDVIGRRLHPHNFCLPIAKKQSDREMLLEVVVTGHERFFLGSDSAPHPRGHKECPECRPGCFTAPVLLEGLAQVVAPLAPPSFLGPVLKTFTSDNGRAWYDLPKPSWSIRLRPESWVAPTEIDGVVPLMAGRTVCWKAEVVS